MTHVELRSMDKLQLQTPNTMVEELKQVLSEYKKEYDSLVREVEELRKEGFEIGVMAAEVASTLGKQTNEKYQPKYLFERNGLRIYYDGYGGLISIKYRGVEVLKADLSAKNPNSVTLYRRGPWIKQLEKFIEESETKKLIEEIEILKKRIEDLKSRFSPIGD